MASEGVLPAMNLSNWLRSLWADLQHSHVPQHVLRTLGLAGHHVVGTLQTPGHLIGAVVAGAATLTALSTAVSISQYRKRLSVLEQSERMHVLMTQLRTSGRIDDNLSKILEAIGKLIQAPYYAFYIWDVRSEVFVLRSVSHPYDIFEGVGPAYSGLALPKREAYLPPPILPAPQQSTAVWLQNDGDVTLMGIRIGERHGLIRLGPVDKVPRALQKQLEAFSVLLAGTMEDYIQLEMSRLSDDVRMLADAAINKVASLAVNVYATVDIVLQAFSGTAGGKGGAFIESKARGRVEVHAATNADWAFQLERDREAVHLLESLGTRGGGPRVITRGQPTFYELPEAIASLEDVGAVILVRLGNAGLLVLLYDISFDHEQFVAVGRRQIAYLVDQLQTILAQTQAQQRVAKSYVHTLCQVADVIDNLNPYTVGYSEMMMRYALVIGREMGMSDKELHDLSLAAHLSNIGVIGLDMELLLKDGQYNAYEYNLMKRHCEIGATMIETVTGNRQAALNVRYHHERFDGNGYPLGVAGSEIPLGAKVLHVVQVFLAKVNGRSWRTPLDFEQAIESLQQSAGTALDPQVVTAFLAWFKRRGELPARVGTSLGACHEMCCVPAAICQSCPAYNAPVRCWEVPDNHCVAHGRNCDNCFVRTEFLFRARQAL